MHGQYGTTTEQCEVEGGGGHLQQEEPAEDVACLAFLSHAAKLLVAGSHPAHLLPACARNTQHAWRQPLSPLQPRHAAAASCMQLALLAYKMCHIVLLTVRWWYDERQAAGRQAGTAGMGEQQPS